MLTIIFQNIGNLEEMNKFLETKNLQRLNHEEIGNLRTPKMNKKTELVIKDVPTKKVQDQMVS